MKLEIGTGDPPESGRYACYLPGVGLATIIRTWHAPTREWFARVDEKVSGPVAGWIGPLPPFPENSAQNSAREYDL